MASEIVEAFESPVHSTGFTPFIAKWFPTNASTLKLKQMAVGKKVMEKVASVNSSETRKADGYLVSTTS